MKRVNFMYAAGFVAIVAGIAAGVYSRPGAVFFRRYEGIELGMTRAEVTGLFKQGFDFTCTFRGCTIGYISRGGMDDTVPSGALVKKPIASMEDIPDFYGNGQFLFDREGRLVAYTWNGEEIAVHTVMGDVPGSILSVLDEELWMRIVGGEKGDGLETLRSPPAIAPAEQWRGKVAWSRQKGGAWCSSAQMRM